MALALVALNMLLLAPHLATDFTSQPWNNDYILMAMTRMFRARPWGWNPLWYCGFPSTYAYPPLFHALVAAMPVSSVGHAYHLVSGVGYALVPAALYLLALSLFGSRLVALVAALAWSLFPSPIYVFPSWASLARGFQYAPWPFVALVEHAEAPHILSLAFAALALGAAWRGRWTAASVCTGAVLLTNYTGAAGLVAALAALGIAQGRVLGFGRAALRILGVAGAGYGLAAFWITPGLLYANTTLARNVLPYREQIAAPWNATTWMILLASASLLALSVWRRVPPAPAFLLAWLALSGTPVAAFTLVGNHLQPMPWRQVLELNLVLLLAVSGLACIGRTGRIALLAVAALLGGMAVPGFVRHAWAFQPRSADPRQLVSFEIADWLVRHVGGARVLAAGELNWALNIWADTPQVIGGGQGLSNVLIEAAHKEVTQGCADAGSAEIAQLWLRALAAPYLVVHGAASREHLHWFVQPERFSSLPLVWTNGHGDSVYRLPPPEVHEAVVVDKELVGRLPPLRSTADREFLAAYVAWAEGKRPARVRWTSAEEATVEADLAEGEGILVKINYDPGWRIAGGRTRPDPIGFLLLDLPPGHRQSALRFGAAWDVWLGRVITLATLLLLLGRAPLFWMAVLSLAPTAIALAALSVNASSRAAVAAETFRRVHPPIISPGGIVDGASGAQPLTPGGSVSIYGLSLGQQGDQVRVWAGNREAPILYRGAGQVNIRLPNNVPDAVEITVEVNGCRGNSFVVPTR